MPVFLGAECLAKEFKIIKMNIIFTGQSGLDVAGALSRYSNDCNYFHYKSMPSPRILKIEDVMAELYAKQMHVYGQNRQRWQQFLREPYSVQSFYWEKAFECVLEKASKDESDICFINFHAVYYHRKTQEYISLLRVRLIEKLRPLKIVTFIDDIYDVWDRLSASDYDIFWPIAENDEVYKKITVLRQLGLVLDWREKEIMMSRFLAKELSVDHFLLAMKHPWETLTSLLFENKKRLYLSHPISKVRPLDSNPNHDDVDKKKLRHEITALGNRLCKEYAAFLPTTIDEFRLRQVAGVFCSKLNPRWEQHIYDHPENVFYAKTRLNGDDCLWEDADSGDSQYRDFNEIEKGISYLIQSLNSSIGAQVSSRDYKLVEQSEILFVYRPFYMGNSSGGVAEEIKYHNILTRSSAPRENGRIKYMFVYCPKNDLKIYVKRQFEGVLEKWVQEDELFYCAKWYDFNGITAEELDRLYDIFDNEGLLMGFLNDVMVKYDVKLSQKAYDTLGVDYPLSDPEGKFSEIKRDFIQKYINCINVVSEYRSSADIFDDSDEFDVNGIISLMKTLTNKKEEK